MRARQPRPLTLTNRLLLLAAVIVLVTALMIAVTTAAGVYDMAVRQEASRQAAYRDMLVAELSGRLSAAQRAVRAGADAPAVIGDDVAAIGRTLSQIEGDGAQLAGVALVDSDGRTVASRWADDASRMSLPGGVLTRIAETPSAPTFVWDHGEESGGPGTLWTVVPAGGGELTARYLVGLIRTDFITASLEGVSRSVGLSSAVLFDEQGTPLFTGSGAPKDATYTFVEDEAAPGTGKVQAEGERGLVGYYAVMPAPAGIGWSVGVLEPTEQAWRDTWAALRPGLLGWAAALGVALIVSVAVVGKVTRPLRQLEVRARALASGAAVEQATVGDLDEIGRLLEAFNSVARRVDRLGDIAELLARASDRKLVLEGVTSSIAHMVSGVDVGVLLLGEDERLDLVAAEGAMHGHERASVPVDAVPWIAEALRSGEPAVARLEEADALASLHAPTPAAALVVPLRAGTEIIGVVLALRPDGPGFTDGETETVRSFAAQASVALQNSRLFEEERRSRREAEALRAVAERIGSPTALDETLHELGRTAAGLLGFTSCAVVIEEPTRFGLDEVSAGGDQRGWLDVWREARADGIPESAPVLIDDSGDDELLSQLLTTRNASAALLIPLRLEDSPAGVLVLLTARRRLALDERRLGLAETMGSQASLALKNAYLFEQAKNRADNLETIFRISHAVGSSLQSRIVLNRVLDVVQKILSADAVMLMTYDPRRKVMTVPMARGVLNQDMLEATFRPGEDVPGRVFETRQPERYDRISGSDTRLLNAAASQGLESLLVVPLMARGRSIGVLAAFAVAEEAFSSEELDLLRTFASQAALAIDTADMFSREHHVASVLQQSILPARLPRVPGLEASSVYLPAGGDAEIGGDYYDLFPAADGRVVVSIGDVCGKGVEAATKTSMIKYSIRAMIAAGLGPSRILTEINRMLMESGDPSNIVTLWIGCIDVGAHTLTYADGGHPPGLVLEPISGRIMRLGTTGALLGAVSDTSWSERTVAFGCGATLLLYTDGVTEARHGARFFGEGRVRRSLRQGGGAAAVVQRLYDLVARFSSGEMRDDAAILAVVRDADCDD